MSAERLLGAALCAMALAAGHTAAADDDYPDVEFLDYLGSWEGPDAEWILFYDVAGIAATHPEPAQEPEPADESREQDDET